MFVSMKKFIIIFLIIYLPTNLCGHIDLTLRRDSIVYGLASVNSEIHSKCSVFLKQFIEAANNKTLWALKMIDSSGRPEQGFLWGNNYWLGQQTQCLAAMDRKPLELSTKFLTLHNITDTDFPPYRINFYGAYVRHNFSLQQHVNLENEDLVEIGLCLPSVCDTKEIHERLQAYFDEHVLNVQSFYNFQMKLVKIKNLQDDFQWLYTKKFVLMMVIVAFITVMAIVGTIYDVTVHQPRLLAQQNLHLLKENNNNKLTLSDAKSKAEQIPPEILPKILEIDDKPLNFFYKFMLCFSIPTNVRILFNTKLSSDSIPCIHGLRFGSMLWVIVAHTIYYMSDFVHNKPQTWKLAEDPFAQIIANATLSVDSFFFMSGFLVAYLYYKKNFHRIGDKTQKLSAKLAELFNMVVLRYLRLTPTLMVAIVLFSVNFEYYGQTSIFETQEKIYERCEKYWWRNLFYINNLYPWNELCLSWSWYLSADMQFFIITSALVLLSTMYFIGMMAITVALIIFSCVITTYIAFIYNFIPTMDEYYHSSDYLYDKPWVRIGPYLVGAITGYWVVRLNGELKLKKPILVLCWIIGPLINLLILFGIAKRTIPVPTSAVYAGLSRTLWGVGLAWLLIACTTNNAGVLNRILSFRGFIPFSKMTYCAYLINPFLLLSQSFDTEVPKHIDFMSIGTMGFSLLFGSFVCGFILTLLIETPTIRIVQIFTRSDKSNDKKTLPK